jgi:hypothetical protein
MKMKKNIITIEIEMKDSTTMFAVNRMIGYRDFTQGDDFSTSIHLHDEEDDRDLIIFTTNLKGFEDVARIIEGVEVLNLGKEEDEKTEED